MKHRTAETKYMVLMSTTSKGNQTRRKRIKRRMLPSTAVALATNRWRTGARTAIRGQIGALRTLPATVLASPPPKISSNLKISNMKLKQN